MKLAVLLVSLFGTGPAQPNGEATPAERAAKLVRHHVIELVAANDASAELMSRRAPPPQQRRVRVTDVTARSDASGGRFFSFSVDERRGYFNDPEKGWRADALTGCVYPETGEVYVNFGHEYRLAKVLLGKRTPPAGAHVCREATTS